MTIRFLGETGNKPPILLGPFRKSIEGAGYAATVLIDLGNPMAGLAPRRAKPSPSSSRDRSPSCSSFTSAERLPARRNKVHHGLVRLSRDDAGLPGSEWRPVPEGKTDHSALPRPHR